jgi:hypothetical protein
MPRIDPITGVPVMTNTEFWEAEGKLEEKSAYQVQEEFYKEFEQEKTEWCEQTLTALPSRIRHILFRHYGDCPTIIEILEIKDFKAVMTFKRYEISAKVLCKLEEGIKWFVYGFYNQGGSFYEPPGMDEWLTEID